MWTTVNVSAETTLLVCQLRASQNPPFQVTIDFTNRTVKIPGYDIAPANISEATISFSAKLSGSGSYREGTIDRISGLYSDRPCQNGVGCGGFYLADCHKGSQQF
jgi:hypothetical protein